MSTGHCEHCGASMREHRHTLNEGMLQALKSLYRAAGLAPMNIKTLGLTRNQWDNFQKLRYWGLVAKKPGMIRSGEWFVTALGLEFMRGNATIPKSVWTYRGEPRRFDGEAITIYSLFPTAYRRHQDYADDAREEEP